MKITIRRAVLGAVVVAAAVGAVGLTGQFAGSAQATPAAKAAPVTQQAQSQTVAYGQHHIRVPRIVAEWADAWNTANPAKMAALFTRDGVYQDNAFGVTMKGRQGVANWVNITERSVGNAHIELTDAFGSGDKIAIRWNFSGTDVGAFDKSHPATGKSFNVPVFTSLDLCGGKISKDTDYYNLAAVLQQVGVEAPHTS